MQPGNSAIADHHASICKLSRQAALGALATEPAVGLASFALASDRLASW